jgi:predicted dehydrogenase
VGAETKATPEAREVRIGFVGLGQIARMHLKRYAEIPGVKVVAAADIDEQARRSAAEEFSIPDVCSDFREVLQRDDIEAVDVCLHNNLHAPVTIEAMRAGKHVYCEKPMAGAYVDAKVMYDQARKLGRMLHIQLWPLYRKETKAAKRIIDAGALGRLYHARSTGYRRRGRPYVDGYGTASFVRKAVSAGGAIYDMGVYHIAQVLHLLGMPTVERVSGKVYQETEMDAARRQTSGYNVEELGLGLIRCADGVTIDIIESWAIHLDPFEGSYVVGSAGGIRLQPFSFHTTLDGMLMDGTIDLEEADKRWHTLARGRSGRRSVRLVPEALGSGASRRGRAAPDGRACLGDDARE